MPYATERDREIRPLEYTQTPWPLAPLNLFLTSGFTPGVFDLRWDDPSSLALNSRYRLLGVNLYRSFDSEYGPFTRISESLVGSNFWRDQTDNELVIEEDVSGAFLLRGPAGSGTNRWVFKTESPVVKEASQNIPADNPDDVRVYIDGIPVRPLVVRGFCNEVEIDPRIFPDVVRQKLDPSLVPGANSRVTCTYRRNRSFLRTDLGQRVFYRVTTVGVPIDAVLRTSELLETPLENGTATSSQEIEKLDWIWREAVRRNRFILEQGGERVKIFLRKHAGVPCTCFQDEYHRQPLNDCLKCYGTGIQGGYEGPFETIVAPDDAERRISQKDIGRSMEHTYEVWTGPVPILSQRDFLVKLNGERYSVGAVRFPSNRGMVLQQHFNIGHLDEKDIRYRVPIDQSTRYENASMFLPSGPEREAVAEPLAAKNAPVGRDLKGRTPAWSNTGG